VLGDAGDPVGVGHRPGGDHQVVVLQGGTLVEVHTAGLEVDPRHAPHPHVRISVTCDDAAHRVRDVVGIEAGRRHLVEQRLEGVEVVRVDHHDVDRRTGQALRDGEPAEPCAHHDHSVTSFHHRATVGRPRHAVAGLSPLWRRPVRPWPVRSGATAPSVGPPRGD
jgi:hypothetical protein